MTVRFDDEEIIKRVRAATMRGVVRATEEVREDAISLIQNPPKSGRTYRRRGVEHQASAPGEAPASDTGRLVNSLETRYDTEALSGTVVTTVDYGPMLEYGTEKMEPRPFLRPALASKQDVVLRYVEEEIAKELK